MLFLTGDLSGAEFGRATSSGAAPWEDPELLPRDLADHLCARDIRTPLLIQHTREATSGRTIGQARGAASPSCARLRRPVRLMRVPERDPRADAVGHAVPPRREPRPGPRLVPPLPRRRASAACRPSRGRGTGASAGRTSRTRRRPARCILTSHGRPPARHPDPRARERARARVGGRQPGTAGQRARARQTAVDQVGRRAARRDASSGARSRRRRSSGRSISRSG